jgi:hypothetical protein
MHEVGLGVNNDVPGTIRVEIDGDQAISGVRS